MSVLTDPPFAADPPVKLNINARTLGLVLLVLGALGILFGLLSLFTVLGFCGSVLLASTCGFPILWLLGALIGLAGVVVGTIGAWRMYQLDPRGKEWVIYGLLLGFVGQVVTLIGNITAYSGILGYAAGAAVFGLVFSLVIYFIIYYMVVISRYPGQTPLTPPTATTWGGPSSPPPPPPA